MREEEEHLYEESAKCLGKSIDGNLKNQEAQ